MKRRIVSWIVVCAVGLAGKGVAAQEGAASPPQPVPAPPEPRDMRPGMPERTLSEAIALLKDAPEPIERCSAADTIGYLGAGQKQRATVALVQALFGDPIAQVRENAARALPHVAHDDPYILSALLAAHRRDPNDEVRDTAAAAVGYMAEPDKPPLTGILECLADESPEVRLAAIRAMCKIGPAARDAIPQMEKLLDDPSSLISLEAGWALWVVARHNRAIPAIIMHAADPGDKERLLAVCLLGKIGPDAKDAVPLLCSMLEEEFPETAESKEDRYPFESTISLVQGGQMRTYGVGRAVVYRGIAAESLGQMGPAAQSALLPIKQLLESSQSPFLRASLLRSMQQIMQDPDAFNILLEEMIASSKSAQAGEPPSDTTASRPSSASRKTRHAKRWIYRRKK